EGSLTRLRARLVKKETLAEVATEMELGPYLKLGGGELKSGGQQRLSILADTLEALICAIYLDSDFERCRQIVLVWYNHRLKSLTMAADQRDAKSQLQEFLQSRRRPLPVYRLIDSPQPNKSVSSDEENRFFVSCQVDGLLDDITAEGSSRRAAEQAAASLALEQVNVSC
ncbi:MAG: ribonuclease III, partial [Immundisolibacteraceae bacterium]|nr:ribonuclease III [Immundisolibacteraceae bacterium]